MKSIPISVTKKDIKQGVKGRADMCPVALAIGREMNTNAVKVWGDEILVRTHYALTSRSVSRFINRFDQNKPVKPFNFLLKISSDC